MAMKKKLGVKGDTKPGDLKDAMEKHGFKKAKKAMPKTFDGKSTKLGMGGRAAKLKAQLTAKKLPKKEIGGIIGKMARAKGAAPGQKNYKGMKKGKK